MGEALSSLLCKAADAGVIQGVRIGNSKLRVSHIQFADDLIMFIEANEEAVRNTKRLLRLFGLCSGLKLNMKKTKLFGVNVADTVLSKWANKISCHCDVLPTDYLGLPLGVTRNSKELWNPILQKFQIRFAGWKMKALSFGGRIVLAKSVLANLPTYYLSLFQMPVSIASKLNNLIAKFIWGGQEGKSIHWLSWEVLCKPIVGGGLGLCDLRLKNRAMLNKWIWRYGGESSSLWRKVVDAKYDYDPLSLCPKVRYGNNISWLWKNISRPLFSSTDVLSKNLRFVLGNGETIDFWNGHWTEVPSLKLAFPRVYAIALRKEGKVKDFGYLCSNGWEWRIILRRQLFEWERGVWEVFIRTLNNANRGEPDKDKLYWNGASNGVFTVKTFCDVVSIERVERDTSWKVIWSSKVPHKTEAFVWKAVHHRIPTRVELSKRGVVQSGSVMCPLCEAEPETVSHLLIHCSKVWVVWQKWCCLWNVRIAFPANFKSFFQVWINQSMKPSFKPVWILAFFGIAWSIWLSRNVVVFENRSWDLYQTFDKALLLIGFWCRSNWPQDCLSVLDFVRNPAAVSIGKRKNLVLLPDKGHIP
ncbi:hypothetical protein GQ457_07G003570 [Hibiscus cannabinus]